MFIYQLPKIILNEIFIRCRRYNIGSNLRSASYRIDWKVFLVKIERHSLHNSVHHLWILDFVGHIQWIKGLDNAFWLYCFLFIAQFDWFRNSTHCNIKFQRMEHTLYNITFCSLHAEPGNRILARGIFSCWKCYLADIVSFFGLINHKQFIVFANIKKPKPGSNIKKGMRINNCAVSVD